MLKPAGGYGGDGIEFVRSAAEVQAHVAAAAALARELPFHGEREHIPGWVVQAHVRSRLALGGRKLHLRAHAVALRRRGEAASRWFVHARSAEARVAAAPLLAAAGVGLARAAHITNGAGGSATERLLADDARLAGALGARASRRVIDFVRGALRRLRPRATRARDADRAAEADAEFAVAAADVMLDARGRFRLLEINVNPSAPPPSACSGAFAAHLAELVRDVADLVLRGDAAAFAPVGAGCMDDPDADAGSEEAKSSL